MPLFFPSHVFQEAISALRVLNILNMYVNFLGKNLAFVSNNAGSTWGYTADSVLLWAQSGLRFLSSALSFLVDSHTCGHVF